MEKDRIKKMNDDLLKKDTKKKKTEKEIFDKGNNKNTRSSQMGKAKTWKQKFNKKYNQPLNKSNSLQEISKLTKISVKELTKIREKGEAAYYNNPQSVRPQVKNPTQWGIARVYSAVMGGPAAKIDKEELKRGKK